MKKATKKKGKEKGEGGGSREKNKLRKVFLQFVLKN